MEYKDVLSEFAERTLANLEKIRTLEQQERSRGVTPARLTVFPITQQVNSLLGLVVFPKEGYQKHIPQKTIAQLVAEGWPSLPITRPNPICNVERKTIDRRDGCADADCSCVEHRLSKKEQKRCQDNHRDCKTLAQLIRVLRNGVSHFNIEFKSDPDTREITFIEVSNRCTCCDQITTTVKLSVDKVRDIAERYARLIIEHNKR